MLGKQFETLAVFKVVDNLTKPIDEMAKAVDGLKKSLEVVRDRLDKLQEAGRKMAEFGTAISAPFAGATYLAVNFDKAMNEAATLVDMSLKEFRERYDRQILNLAKELGQSPDQVARAFYQAISSGLDPDKAISFLKQAGKAAIAGVSDIFTATDGLTTALNAWKEFGYTVGQLSDYMFLAVKAGKTTFREIASSIGNVAPIAAKAGVSIQEVLAAMATATTQGATTSEAFTGIRAAIEAIVNPTSQAERWFEKLGVQIDANTLKQKGLKGTLEILSKAIRNYTDDEAEQKKILAEIFGQVEGLNQVFAITGAGGKKFAEILKMMGESAGATDKAFKKMAQSASFQLEQMKASLQVLGISIGTLLLPPLNALLKTVTNLIKPITDFIQTHQTLAKVLVYPAVGIGILLTALGSLAVAVGWLGKGFLDGARTLVNFWTELKKTALWSRLTSFAVMPLNAQLSLLNARLKAVAVWSWTSLKNLYGWVKSLTVAFWQAQVSVVRFTVATLRLQTVEQVKGAFNAVISVIGNLRKAVLGFIAVNPYLIAFAGTAFLIYKFWKPIKAFFTGLFEGLKEGFAEAFAPLKPILSPVIGVFKTLFGWIGKLLKPVDDAGKGFKTVASIGRMVGRVLFYALFPVLIPIKLIVSALSGFQKAFSVVAEFISVRWKTAVKVFFWTNPVTAPITALKKLYDFAKSINLFEIGKQIIEGLWKGLVSMAKKPIEAIENVGRSIKEKFKSLLGISSPSKLFMQFGRFLNEGLGLGMVKSLGTVKNAVKKVFSVLNFPAKKEIQFLLKPAFEQFKALALPASLTVSLLSPVNAVPSPVKQIEKTFSTKEKLVAERVVKETKSEESPVINLTLNFSPVINTENKEEIRQVLQSYLPDFVRQVEEAIRKIEEQRKRREY